MFDCFIKSGGIARRRQVNHNTIISVAHNMRRYGSVMGPSKHHCAVSKLDILVNVPKNSNSFVRNTGNELGRLKNNIWYYGRFLIFLGQMVTWDAEENILWTYEAKFISKGTLNRWNFCTFLNCNKFSNNLQILKHSLIPKKLSYRWVNI